MPKVSVIVPIYGVEQYIERCARSLFEQTIDDIEYIFVNDCTKDNSIAVLNKIIEEYPNRKSQIKILNHEVNQGLPMARQTGVKAATGDYVIHCDSDDWVSCDAYEKMYAKAKFDDADIVICNFYISDGGRHIQYYNQMSTDKSSVIFSYINIWTHLVRKCLYANKITFPSGNMFEDRVVTIQLACYANKISILDEPLYYYFNNMSSICRTFTEESCVNRFNQAVTNVKIISDFIRERGIYNDFKIEMARLKYEARHQLAPITNKKVYYKLWKKCYPEINKEFIVSSEIRMSEKIRFLLTYFHLFPFFRKM